MTQKMNGIGYFDNIPGVVEGTEMKKTTNLMVNSKYFPFAN